MGLFKEMADAYATSDLRQQNDANLGGGRGKTRASMMTITELGVKTETTVPVWWGVKTFMQVCSVMKP